MSDKQIAAEAIAQLPESVSLADIAEELRIIAAIRQGDEDVEAGRVLPHDDVKKLVASWAQEWKRKARSD